jgi:putative transposase
MDLFTESPGKRRGKNRRNGHSQKTVQGGLGEFKIATLRDRDGTFEPQLVPKHQHRLSRVLEKILALYAKGMTARDIQEIVKELYGVGISPTLNSEITADLEAEVIAWRTRQLDPIWPIVYLDGIVVHVRSANGRVLPQAVYVALGVNLQGRKELLGLWLSETEGAKFWLSCLTDLKNRGLKDIFIACVDGLTGFTEVLHTAYPEAKVQLCIVHLVRAVLKYVTDKESDQVIADLKKIYRAMSVIDAEAALESFAEA